MEEMNLDDKPHSDEQRPSKLRSHALALCGVPSGKLEHRKLNTGLLVMFTVAFLYTVCFFYFWIVVWNRFDDLDWKLYMQLDRWTPWYSILLGLTSVVFAYFTSIMCVILYHLLIRGHQPYVHPVHAVVSFITIGFSIAVTVGIYKLWKAEWSTALMSLKITGPFLQLGAVIFVTLLAWFLVHAWMMMSSKSGQVLVLVIFLILMMFLYLSPLVINSPCVVNSNDLPPKPKILAHRGASEILPENTLMAYQRAYDDGVWGIESDVQISKDCVPFILHDRSLKRTTNVQELFPERAGDDSSTFTMEELKTLDAGTWFFNLDPKATASRLTPAERKEALTQKLPTLKELSSLASNYPGRMFMFDLLAPPESHPCYNVSVNVTIDAIVEAGFPLKNLLWLEGTFDRSRPTGVRLVGEFYIPTDFLKDTNIDITNVQYIELTDQNIEEYQKENISINVWVINSEWFYSLYWCMGITSVTSDRCHVLEKMTAPLWQMEPSGYLALWIVIDLLSVGAFAAIVYIQRKRLSGSSRRFIS